MKLLRLLLVLLGPVLLFWGCSKEKSFEVGNGTLNEWEFSEGSNFFKGTIDTAYKTEVAAGVTALLLEGTSDDGTGTLTLGVIGLNTSVPGTYQSPSVLFDYSKQTGTVYQNDVTATGQFTIEVTKIDSASISGTFTGKAKDSTGTLKTITSGKFSARFGLSTPQAGDAQIVFWSKSSCNAGSGSVSVKLSNGQTGSISAFTASAPACGAAGAANFNIPAGTYGYEAVCGTDTIRGVVTAAANQCLRQEVAFGSATPTGQVIFWAKSGCNGNPINIKFNNQNANISNFSAAAPATCTPTAGNPGFTVAPGIYTMEAICGTDTVRVNVNVQANQCTKVEVSLPTGPNAQYSLVSSGGTCSNYQIHGTYYAGKALSQDTNTVIVQVNVTQVGAYTVSTNTINGYSFFASGVFISTGIQNVTMKGQGTPVATGTNSFTVTAGASTCSFPITVQQLPAGTAVNKWSFTEGSRNFSGEFPLPAIFGDDVWGFGKALDMLGQVQTTDTLFDLYIQFPASATQPIPGTYVTEPLVGSQNTSDFNLFNIALGEQYYYAKDIILTPPPYPNVKMTIIITSYDPVTKIVKGTFSGTAWNGAGTIVNITNGKFETEVEF